MNTDAKIRQSFQELRTADTQRVPVFSRVARAPVRSFTMPWLRLAAGAAVLVTLIVVVTTKSMFENPFGNGKWNGRLARSFGNPGEPNGRDARSTIFQNRSNHSPADTQQWTALSNWRATTDELLTVSSTPLGSTISTPTDSWIETQTNQKETL